MEMELNSLIDKIKTEGVQQAEQDARNIIKQAEAKAKEIIEAAEHKSADAVKKAESEANDFKKSSEKALKQAARDVLLTLRARVTDFAERIVQGKVTDSLTPEMLKEIIVKAVENFSKGNDTTIEVLLNEKDRDKLEKAVFGDIKKEAKEYLKLKESKSVKKGFRIGEKGKESYFDFTDEAISEAFMQYLNPKLVEMLDIDLGIGGQTKDGE